MHRISKQEENEFPLFTTHEEAITFFEEKYGEKFVFEESSDTSDVFGSADKQIAEAVEFNTQFE